MGRFNDSNNFLYLTGALLVLLIVTPLLDTVPVSFAYWVVKGITAGTIIISFLSLDYGLIWRKFNIFLVLILLVSSLQRTFSDWQPMPLLDLGVTLVFFMGVAYSAARRVLLSGEVDGNSIVGAIAIYLLLGLIWATIYLIALEFSPTAFNGMEHLPWEENFSRSTYFSYVTLTTLGYGDISPAEPVSRVLVYLEAMAGTFYMAVVIASLIGARAGKRKIQKQG